MPGPGLLDTIAVKMTIRPRRIGKTIVRRRKMQEAILLLGLYGSRHDHPQTKDKKIAHRN